MMKQAIFMPILLASLVGWASSASAEMYKWTDSSGKTHYSATPPPADVKAKNIEAEINLSSGKSKVSDAPKTDAAAPETKTETPTDKAVKPEEAAQASEKQHRSYCDQQKQALQQISTNSLVKYTDEKGERFLNAAEKQEKIASISKNIETMCGPEMFSSATGVAAAPANAAAKPAAPATDTTTTGQTSGK